MNDAMSTALSQFLVRFSVNLSIPKKIDNPFPRLMPSHQLQLPPRNKILDNITGLNHQSVMHEDT